MAHINTFNNQPGATFTDNSVTVNAQQNNTQFNTENQLVQPTDASPSDSGKRDTNIKPIRLNPDIDKIDFIRIINAMCELKFFTTQNGLIATKKHVFCVFGNSIGKDLSRYANNLSAAVGTSSSNEDAATEKIFELLKNAAVDYNHKSLEKRNNI